MAPTIEQFMTPTPQVIGAKQTLDAAAEIMRKSGVRHLPVCDDGKVVGVLSDRDLARSDAARDTRRLFTPVGEVMRREPYCVEPTTLLTDVVREMAERRIGSALIVHGNTVCGIFTSVDAARVLADLVEAVDRAGGALQARSQPQ
jgi:CBS domain-containing protein